MQTEIAEFDEFVKLTNPKLQYILFTASPAFRTMEPVAIFENLELAKQRISEMKKHNISTMNGYYLIPCYNFFL